MLNRYLTITLGALLFVTCLSRTAWPQKDQADESNIKQALTTYLDAFNHHDAAAVGASFAEDADRTTLRGDRAHGRDAIQKSYGSLFQGRLKNANRTATVKSIRFLTPDIALLDGDFAISGAAGNDGSPLPGYKGFLDLIMTRHGDKWLITDFHESEYPAS